MLIFSKRFVRMLAVSLVALVMLGCLVGCMSEEVSKSEKSSTTEQLSAEVNEAEYDDGTNFVLIKTGYPFYIICNTKTRVMYAMSVGQYNRGGLTPLLNQNGEPMIYEEDLSTFEKVE